MCVSTLLTQLSSSSSFSSSSGSSSGSMDDMEDPMAKIFESEENMKEFCDEGLALVSALSPMRLRSRTCEPHANLLRADPSHQAAGRSWSK